MIEFDFNLFSLNFTFHSFILYQDGYDKFVDNQYCNHKNNVPNKYKYNRYMLNKRKSSKSYLELVASSL